MSTKRTRYMAQAIVAKEHDRIFLNYITPVTYAILAWALHLHCKKRYSPPNVVRGRDQIIRGMRFLLIRNVHDAPRPG